MGALTVRRIDDALKASLRQRAARNGRSMEEEVRRILARAVAEPDEQDLGLGTVLHRHLMSIGGGVEADIDPPPREAWEPRVRFDD